MVWLICEFDLFQANFLYNPTCANQLTHVSVSARHYGDSKDILLGREWSYKSVFSK